MGLKKYTLTILLSLALIVISCSPMYQILETTSPDTKLENDAYVYENTDVKISYDFWSDGGSISFFIFNKLDQPIYIDWDKSHLIYNGSSYEYWFDSEETKSFYSSSTQIKSSSEGNALINIITDGTSTRGNASSRNTNSTYRNNVGFALTTKFKPKKIIHIPSKSGIFVSKFTISKNPYYTCDFNLKSIISKTEIKTQTFSQDESPLNFRNYITYSMKESFDSSQFLDNEFYISLIQNMNLYAFKGKYEHINYCKVSGLKASKIEYPYPYKKPNRFYIKSSKK
jgi:hypothetical protein